MARTPQIGLASQNHLLLKPLKNQTAWKPVLARLKLLTALLPIMDLAGPGSRHALSQMSLRCWMRRLQGCSIPCR